MQGGEPGESEGSHDPGHGRRPSLLILLAALVGVSAVVLVLALVSPFSPSGDVGPVAAGNAANGATLFEGKCAGCHGPQGSGGGIGPTLAGRALQPDVVAGIIASGRGAMPAGLVSGAERDDVVAYVVELGGGEVAAPAANEPETTAATEATGAEETVVAEGEGDPVQGAALFDQTCAGCHGPEGAGGGIAPALAGKGLTADAVRDKVVDGGAAMPAGLLAGAELEHVAAYVESISGAGQPAEGEATVAGEEPTEETLEATTPDAPDAAVAVGAAIFDGTCAGCHGPGGEGGGGAPTLAGADLGEDAIRTILANGRGGMPAGLVAGEELDSVVAFVLSISAAGAEAETAPEESAPEDTAPEETEATPDPNAETPSGTVALTGAGLIGLQVNLDAPSSVDADVFLIGPGKQKRVGTIDSGDSELEVENANVGTILDGYDSVAVGPADAPLAVALVAGDVDAMRQLNVSSEVAPDGSSLTAAARGQVKVLLDHIRFLKESQREGNLINVRFHGEHLFNIVRGEPIVDLDGLGGPDNPGDGVGLLGKAGRDGYVPLIAQAAEAIAAGDGADPLAQSSAQTVGEAADQAAGLLSSVAANGNTCAKAPTLQASRVCVQTADRLEEQVQQVYRLMTRFAARVPVFTLQAVDGS